VTADAPPTDDGLDRRRLLRAGAALGIGLLGAGFLRPFGAPDDPSPGDGLRPRRGLAVTVARTPTPTDGGPVGPVPTGGRAPRGGTTRTAGPAPTDPDSTPGATGDGSALVVDAPAVVLADLIPGSSGRATATATLSGDPADLWVAATGVDGGENRLTEPERTAGDVDAAGELLAALDVRLSVGGRTVYDGPLAGLSAALGAGVRVAACATGRVDVALDWALPADAGDAVQTDGAAVTLRVGATDCGATDPFAGG
jgi:hypothetical protein